MIYRYPKKRREREGVRLAIHTKKKMLTVKALGYGPLFCDGCNQTTNCSKYRQVKLVGVKQFSFVVRR